MFDLNKDIQSGLKKYSSLLLSEKEGKPIIEGIFTAHKGNIKIENYDVWISFPVDYPYNLPIVIETSKKIFPRNATRHIFRNDTLCFGNLQDVLRVCRKGITFKWFLDNILNTHLCREYVKDKTGVYPTGERSHDTEGIWEGYYEIFKNNNKKKILKELELMLTHNTFPKNRLCYCGLEKKYKRCHEILECLVFDIGRKNVRQILKILKQDYEK